MKLCAYCEKPHERARAKYCDDLCQHRAYNDRRKADGRLAAYRAKNRDRHRAYLRAYWAEHGSVRELYPEATKAADQRRRARKAGVESETIRSAEVFSRDAWVCSLCGGPVDRSAVWPAPDSASVDHVVPISKGGSHTMENVMTAHLRCNLSKGNRVEAA
ncbi:HNH endonuclease [Streptomyces sp. NPDC057557]|uniref:HNH endonuclease n=1 Tax=Streptomyces sp. NPDC057557 TaxID=3346167 RepID=UPI00369E6553